jgi:hypothetical protein
MLKNEEITCVRCGRLVRFYLPHVIRDLTGVSSMGKRRFARTTSGNTQKKLFGELG